jgi:orotidine-5'-phosphate decarboxylase
MMKKAVETRNKLEMSTKILAVTVLTTMEDKDSKEVFNEEVKHEVLKLAKLALESGVDGIVCSPREAEMLKEVFGEKYPNFEIVTPGIRMKDTQVSGDDQKRTKTPDEAIK